MWYKNLSNYNGKYLETHLPGGLCNKLFCLFSACDIVLKEGGTIIEPYFGWNKKILFSDIYDLDYFNHSMSKYRNGAHVMITRDTATNDKKIIRNTIEHHINLWKYSQKDLAVERRESFISKDSTKLKVLNALKLKSEYEKIVQAIVSGGTYTAIQMRIESDWVKYAASVNINGKEVMLVSLGKLIEMLADFKIEGKLFFTSGENQQMISDSLNEAGFENHYFYNPDLEYEINAAINFEICCNANAYIGLSRSTYSNLISLKRAAILNNDNSYIYNYNNKILRRIDKGLQPGAELSINKITEIA
jgi:hypothetical protein